MMCNGKVSQLHTTARWLLCTQLPLCSDMLSIAVAVCIAVAVYMHVCHYLYGNAMASTIFANTFQVLLLFAWLPLLEA